MRNDKRTKINYWYKSHEITCKLPKQNISDRRFFLPSKGIKRLGLIIYFSFCLLFAQCLHEIRVRNGNHRSNPGLRMIRKRKSYSTRKLFSLDLTNYFCFHSKLLLTLFVPNRDFHIVNDKLHDQEKSFDNFLRELCPGKTMNNFPRKKEDNKNSANTQSGRQWIPLNHDFVSYPNVSKQLSRMPHEKSIVTETFFWCWGMRGQ